MKGIVGRPDSTQDNSLEIRVSREVGEAGSIFKFPHVAVAVRKDAKDITAFTVQDSTVRGLKPGHVLVCRPYKKDINGLKPTTVVLVRIDGQLVPRRFRDAEGDIVAVAFAVQKPLP